MKKKLLSLLLLSMMLLAFTGCGKKKKAQGQLVIGNITELSGDWEPFFQNNGADFDIYNIINGYKTVVQTSSGEFVFDKTVIKKHEVVNNDDGSKTYQFVINKGLKWNDEAGTEITAKDFLSYILLWNSKVIADMGGDTSIHQYLLGWKDYSQEGKKEFAGVRLLGDYEFSLTIDPENLPYYYELPMVASQPLNLTFWTDENLSVADDGNGAYIAGDFTVDAYKGKINKARTAVPQVSCGAYSIASYDESSKTAVLEVNDRYKGNWEGVKPSIKTLIYKVVTEETQFDELRTGAIDLLMQSATGVAINAGLDLVDEGGFNYNAYDRSGYGNIQFVCDFGPTQFVEVRQAIAHLLDRNEFAKTFTGGHGMVVNGPYGTAMWSYKESKNELDEKLNMYSYSLEEAQRLLEEGGWIYDDKGNPYTSGIRHKKLEDGTFMPLIIEWASSGNVVSELLVIRLKENPDVAKVGMQINENVMSFTELLNFVYRDGSQDPKYGVPTYHMFNLATSFTARYDLTNVYTTDPVLIAGGTNTNFILDEKLENFAKAMVKADPTDKEAYKKGFVDFIVRWNELMPDIPLYSNIYHDFFNEKLKDYNANDLWDISEAIIYAHVEE